MSKRDLNILFITCWYPVPRNPNFGIFVKEHARAVQKSSAHVMIAHVWAEPSTKFFDVRIKEKEDEFSGLKTCSLLIYSRLYKFFRYFWFLLYPALIYLYNNHIKQDFSPDCLHAQVSYPAGFLAHSLSKRSHIPYILSEHWSKVHTLFKSTLFAGKARKVFEDASSVHPVSGYLSENIQNLLPFKPKMSVIPNVVSDEFKYRARKRNDGFIELLCIMNHRIKKVPDKRPDLIAAALAKLPRQIQGMFRVRYIGTNQDKSPVKSLLSQKDIQAEFIFDGHRPKGYIAARMNEADYLVHPTEKETFGVVVAEALKSGLPCVISNVPALKELIDESSGIVVTENTAEAWQNVLRDLSRNTYNFNRRNIAQENKDKYSYGGVGKQFFRTYQKAIQDHRMNGDS